MLQRNTLAEPLAPGQGCITLDKRENVIRPCSLTQGFCNNNLSHNFSQHFFSKRLVIQWVLKIVSLFQKQVKEIWAE